MKHTEYTSLRKSHLLTACCASVALASLSVACGSDADAPAAPVAKEAPAATDAAPAANQANADLPVLELTVSGDDTMKFDTEELEAQPGQTIELTFTNVGTMPKESMGHNWCLLTLGTDVDEFAESGFAHVTNDYIDPDLQDEVIAHTSILGPGDSETISFTAPSEPGKYHYLCTFPGHAMAGMKGILTVK